MDRSDSSPHSKRHSYPVILTYTETLSVLSEHQREYNRKESVKRSRTPVLGQNGTDDTERRQKLQEALDWLSHELKDMYHQDKFLLRQFNHLNRSIQELKDKREIKEESETKPSQAAREKPNASKNEKTKAHDPPAEEKKTTPANKEAEPIIHGEFKLEDLKQAQIKQAQKRQAEMRLQEELSTQKQELTVNKHKQKQKGEPGKQKSREGKQKQQQDDTKQDKRSLNSEYDSDYGSDQSVDKYEVDCLQTQKNIPACKSPKISPKQQRTKRWSWWK